MSKKCKIAEKRWNIFGREEKKSNYNTDTIRGNISEGIGVRREDKKIPTQDKKIQSKQGIRR